MIGVLIPAGPDDPVADTVESCFTYLDGPLSIVVVNDGGAKVADELRPFGDRITVVDAPGTQPSGRQGKLWSNLALGFAWLADTVDCDVVVRLDTDALIIGYGLVEKARARFASEPDGGLLGANRYGPDGGTRVWSGVARTIMRETGPFGLRDPGLRRQLRSLERSAKANGYRRGEHALGAISLMSGPALRALRHTNTFDLTFPTSRLGDDHLLGLATYAAGFRIGEFSRPGDPLAVVWRGLAESPDALVARGVAGIHSVRSAPGWDHAAIRAYFAERRQQHNSNHGREGQPDLEPRPDL